MYLFSSYVKHKKSPLRLFIKSTNKSVNTVKNSRSVFVERRCLKTAKTAEWRQCLFLYSIWGLDKCTRGKKRVPEAEDMEIVLWLGVFFVFNLRVPMLRPPVDIFFAKGLPGNTLGLSTPFPTGRFSLYVAASGDYMPGSENVHSTWILSIPRSRKRRKFMSFFTMAKTPSA